MKIVVPLNKSSAAFDCVINRCTHSAKTGAVFCSGGLIGAENGLAKLSGCTCRPTSFGAGRPERTLLRSASIARSNNVSGRLDSTHRVNLILNTDERVRLERDDEGSSSRISKKVGSTTLSPFALFEAP